MRRPPTWILRRLAHAVPTVLVVTVLVFYVFEELGDPALLDLGRHASPEALAARRHELGLDRPVALRLADRLVDVVTLDFGVSRTTGRPVLAMILDRMLPTLGYALPGFLAGLVFSIAGGLAAATAKARWVDRTVTLFSTLLMSTSSIVIVLVAQWILGHRLGLFPVVGWPLAESNTSVVWHLFLPAMLWMSIQVGPDMRHFRAVFIQEFGKPYLDGLRGRGVPEYRVRRHLLRTSAAAILTRMGMRIPYLLVGSLVIEAVFNVPGIGELAVASVRTIDLAVMEGIVVFLTLATIGVQIVVDLSSRAMDPRVRID